MWVAALLTGCASFVMGVSALPYIKRPDGFWERAGTAWVLLIASIVLVGLADR